MEGYKNVIWHKIQYESFDLHVLEGLKQALIDDFDHVGSLADTMYCFSAKPTTIKEYLCIIIECGQAYAPLAPLVLKALAEKIASKLKSRQIVKYLISKEF